MLPGFFWRARFSAARKHISCKRDILSPRDSRPAIETYFGKKKTLVDRSVDTRFLFRVQLVSA